MMGIDVSAKLMVGCELSKIGCDMGYDCSDWMDEHGLDHASPHYDSDPDAWFVGFEIDALDLADEATDPVAWFENVKARAAEFERITGQKASLQAVPNVW